MSVANLFDEFFVPSMGGLNLGFSQDEQRLAQTVHSVTFDEIERLPRDLVGDPSAASEQDDRIELSKKNLTRILELLERARDARLEFLENFPDWCTLRKEAIERLTEIEQTMHKEKFWCNIGKVAGGVVGGAGAVAIAGALLFPPAVPALLPACLTGLTPFIPTFLLPAAPAVVPALAVNGGIAAGVGGFSSLGTKVLEIKLLQQRMETAKKVLQGDQRAFALMENWFKHTKELIDAVEDLMGFNVIQKLYEDVNVLFDGIKGLNDLKSKSPLWLKAVIKLCIRKILSGQHFVTHLGCGLSAVLVTFMFVVIFLQSRNRFIFKCMVKTRQLMSRFCVDMDGVAELARVFAAVSIGGSGAIRYLPAEAARELSLGVFAGLGIAINAANIVLASIDIKNGSTCRQREEVKNAAEKLREELDLLGKVHEAVATTEMQKVILENENGGISREITEEKKTRETGALIKEIHD